jgi:hypothetical protein
MSVTRAARLVRLLARVLLLGLAGAGCKTQPFRHSGLTEILTSDAMFHRAGTNLGLKTMHDSLPNGGIRGPNVEFARDVEVLLAPGTAGQFITRFYEDALRQIFVRGATIHYSAQAGPGDGHLHDFAYRYRWKSNEGVIRLYSAHTATKQLRIIVYCYEHRL